MYVSAAGCSDVLANMARRHHQHGGGGGDQKIPPLSQSSSSFQQQQQQQQQQISSYSTLTADWMQQQRQQQQQSSRYNFSNIQTPGETPPQPTGDPLQNVYRNQMQQQRDSFPPSASGMQSRVYMDNYNEQTARLFAQAGTNELSGLQPQGGSGENRMGGYSGNPPTSNNDYPYQ